jgi:hypothetical protein
MNEALESPVMVPDAVLNEQAMNKFVHQNPDINFAFVARSVTQPYARSPAIRNGVDLAPDVRFVGLTVKTPVATNVFGCFDQLDLNSRWFNDFHFSLDH